MWSFTWLPDAALRAGVLLTLVFLLTLVLRRDSAAVRHRLWIVGLAGALLMPALGAAVPWTLPLLPATAAHASAVEAYAAETPVRLTAAHEEAVPAPARAEPRAVLKGVEATPAAAADARALPTFAELFPWLWLLGATLLGLRMIIGLVRLGRIARDAVPLDAPGWADALEQACRRLDLTARPRLLATDAVSMPCTTGWVRPILLLPADAPAWTAARRDVVLLHELAHIRRGDILSHRFTQVVSALHWFNPLVWLAARRVHAEAERASDELVLAAAARASE